MLRTNKKAKCRVYRCACNGIDKECPKCHGTGRVMTKPKDHVEALYDSFRVKDLTLGQFREAYKAIMSPARSAKDLDHMRLSLQFEMNNRRKIDDRVAKR